MLATLVTVRSLVIAALVVATATATVVFRPTRVEEVSIAADVRSEVDDVHLRQQHVRADEVRVRERSIRSDEDLRLLRIEAIMNYQPIGCQMRTDATAFAALLAH